MHDTQSGHQLQVCVETELVIQQSAQTRDKGLRKHPDHSIPEDERLLAS